MPIEPRCIFGLSDFAPAGLERVNASTIYTIPARRRLAALGVTHPFAASALRHPQTTAAEAAHILAGRLKMTMRDVLCKA